MFVGRGQSASLRLIGRGSRGAHQRIVVCFSHSGRAREFSVTRSPVKDHASGQKSGRSLFFPWKTGNTLKEKGWRVGRPRTPDCFCHRNRKRHSLQDTSFVYKEFITLFGSITPPDSETHYVLLRPSRCEQTTPEATWERLADRVPWLKCHRALLKPE